MKLLIVDIYGDGDVYRIYEDTPQTRADVAEWRAQDEAYSRGELGEEKYLQIGEWMRRHNHTDMEFEIV